MPTKKRSGTSKGVYERLQQSLQMLASSKMVLIDEPHIILRCHYVEKKGFTRPIIEEILKAVGDRTGYEIADIAPGIKFQWQVRVDINRLKQFKTSFNIRVRSLRIKSTGDEIRVWQHKDSEDCRNIHVDLFPLLLRYRPYQPAPVVAELVDQDAEYRSHKLDHRAIRESPKTKACIDTMYRIFEDVGMTELEATHFEELEQFYSRQIIGKSKKILGVVSLKRENRWWWLPPENPPHVSLKLYHAEKLNAAMTSHVPKPRFDNTYIDRPSVQQLKFIMTRENYDAPVKMIMEEMAPYKRITILKAKQLLCIARFKIDKVWRWVYPSPDVREWLVDQLKRGPVKQTTLFHRAMHQHRWSREVLRVIKRIDSRFKIHMEGQELCWKLDGAVDFGLQPDEMIEAVPIKPVVEKVAQPIQGFKIALFGDDDE